MRKLSDVVAYVLLAFIIFFSIFVLFSEAGNNKIPQKSVETVTKIQYVTKTVTVGITETKVIVSRSTVYKKVTKTVTETTTKYKTVTKTLTKFITTGTECSNATKTIYEYVTFEKTVNKTVTIPARCTATYTVYVTYTKSEGITRTASRQTTMCGYFEVTAPAVCIRGKIYIPETTATVSTVYINIFGSSTTIKNTVTKTYTKTIICQKGMTVTRGYVSGCIVPK